MENSFGDRLFRGYSVLFLQIPAGGFSLRQELMPDRISWADFRFTNQGEAGHND